MLDDPCELKIVLLFGSNKETDRFTHKIFYFICSSSLIKLSAMNLLFQKPYPDKCFNITSTWALTTYSLYHSLLPAFQLGC